MPVNIERRLNFRIKTEMCMKNIVLLVFYKKRESSEKGRSEKQVMPKRINNSVSG